MKNENDVRALQAVIREQNEHGASLPTDLDHPQYRWGENGRLIEISLLRCNLSGHLSIAGLDALEHLECGCNDLTSLDISKNPELKWLGCDYNQLNSLDVSNNPDLKYLTCHNNRLVSLDVSNNPELVELNCSNNQLKALDVSANSKLVALSCDREQLDMKVPFSTDDKTASEAETDYEM